MTQVILMMLLDSSMILLLGATIYFCLRLNTRIKILQDSKAEFSQLIERFDMTTQRAQQSIDDLQNISKRVNEQLSNRLDKANFLADDLAFMIEKGTKIADRMEGRSPSTGTSGNSGLNVNKNTSQADIRTGKAGGPSLRETSAGNGDKETSANDRKRAALESMLNKVSSTDESGENANSGRRRPLMGASARLRSKAEQELYDAIKSGNNN